MGLAALQNFFGAVHRGKSEMMVPVLTKLRALSLRVVHTIPKLATFLFLFFAPACFGVQVAPHPKPHKDIWEAT